MRLVHASRVLQVEELGAGDGDGVAPDWVPRPVVLVIGVIDAECPGPGGGSAARVSPPLKNRVY